MTRTDEMVAWIQAQLGDDERWARMAINQAGAAVWATTSEGAVYDPNSTGNGYLAIGPWDTSLDQVGDHIARWDPARALAETTAKRQILEIHHRIECQHDRNFSTGGDCAECGGEYPCETVRLLALPYAGRPGFPDEWKP